MTQSTTAKLRRRRLQFRLRSLLALVVLASGAMAFWAAYLRPYQRQQRAAETLVALGAELEYEATGPPWLKR